jgi:hypothetical protein
MPIAIDEGTPPGRAELPGSYTLRLLARLPLLLGLIELVLLALGPIESLLAYQE